MPKVKSHTTNLLHLDNKLPIDLINDVEEAAKKANIKVLLSAAITDHPSYEDRKPPKNIPDNSRHVRGVAADFSRILVFDGIDYEEYPVETSYARKFVNKFTKELENLEGRKYNRNAEGKENKRAFLTYGFKGHDDHVHVSNNVYEEDLKFEIVLFKKKGDTKKEEYANFISNTVSNTKTLQEFKDDITINNIFFGTDDYTTERKLLPPTVLTENKKGVTDNKGDKGIKLPKQDTPLLQSIGETILISNYTPEENKFLGDIIEWKNGDGELVYKGNVTYNDNNTLKEIKIIDVKSSKVIQVQKFGNSRLYIDLTDYLLEEIIYDTNDKIIGIRYFDNYYDSDYIEYKINDRYSAIEYESDTESYFAFTYDKLTGNFNYIPATVDGKIHTIVYKLNNNNTKVNEHYFDINGKATTDYVGANGYEYKGLDKKGFTTLENTEIYYYNNFQGILDNINFSSLKETYIKKETVNNITKYTYYNNKKYTFTPEEYKTKKEIEVKKEEVISTEKIEDIVIGNLVKDIDNNLQNTLRFLQTDSENRRLFLNTSNYFINLYSNAVKVVFEGEVNDNSNEISKEAIKLINLQNIIITSKTNIFLEIGKDEKYLTSFSNEFGKLLESYTNIFEMDTEYEYILDFIGNYEGKIREEIIANGITNTDDAYNAVFYLLVIFLCNDALIIEENGNPTRKNNYNNTNFIKYGKTLSSSKEELQKENKIIYEEIISYINKKNISFENYTIIKEIFEAVFEGSPLFKNKGLFLDSYEYYFYYIFVNSNVIDTDDISLFNEKLKDFNKFKNNLFIIKKLRNNIIHKINFEKGNLFPIFADDGNRQGTSSTVKINYYIEGVPFNTSTIFKGNIINVIETKIEEGVEKTEKISDTTENMLKSFIENYQNPGDNKNFTYKYQLGFPNLGSDTLINVIFSTEKKPDSHYYFNENKVYLYVHSFYYNISSDLDNPVITITTLNLQYKKVIFDKKIIIEDKNQTKKGSIKTYTENEDQQGDISIEWKGHSFSIGGNYKGHSVSQIYYYTLYDLELQVTRNRHKDLYDFIKNKFKNKFNIKTSFSAEINIKGKLSYNNENKKIKKISSNGSGLNNNYDSEIDNIDNDKQGLGYIPKYFITSCTVSLKSSLGILRMASISIKAFSLKQLNEIILNYANPGITLVLEWGRTIYPTRKIEFSSDFEVANNPFDIIFPNFKNIVNLYDDFTEKYINENFKDLNNNLNGNHDILIGKVYNFKWSFEQDGSINININIISKNYSILLTDLSKNTYDNYNIDNHKDVLIGEYKNRLNDNLSLKTIIEKILLLCKINTTISFGNCRSFDKLKKIVIDTKENTVNKTYIEIDFTSINPSDIRIQLSVIHSLLEDMHSVASLINNILLAVNKASYNFYNLTLYIKPNFYCIYDANNIKYNYDDVFVFKVFSTESIISNFNFSSNLPDAFTQTFYVMNNTGLPTSDNNKINEKPKIGDFLGISPSISNYTNKFYNNNVDNPYFYGNDLNKRDYLNLMINDSDISLFFVTGSSLEINEFSSHIENAYRIWKKQNGENNDKQYLYLPIGLNLSFTLPGISGLDWGDLFRIDYLPLNLSSSVFQINQITHEINPDNGWTTKIESLLRYAE